MLKPLRIIHKFKENHHCAWIDALKEGKTIITTRRSHSVNTVVLADFYLFRFLENWTTGRRQLGNSQEFPVYAAAVDSNRARKKWRWSRVKACFSSTAELAIIIFFSSLSVCALLPVGQRFIITLMKLKVGKSQKIFQMNEWNYCSTKKFKATYFVHWFNKQIRIFLF